MKNTFYIFIFSIILFSCKESDENTCTTSKCLGPQTLYLSSSDKKLVITKDTTYLFKDTGTDTVRVKFRKLLNDFYTATELCDCKGPNTQTTGDLCKGFYVFLNRNVACRYSTAPVNGGKLGFDIVFGDTNYVVNNIGTSSGFASQFFVGDMNTRPNNYDSLSVNGKYYYNVISSYEYQSNITSGYVTQCFYARNFGIIRFKLNGVIYDVLN